MKSNKGFVLIELLVAVVIILFIGGTLYVTFSQGVKIWKRSQQKDYSIAADIFFEKLTSDLRNAFTYNAQPFKGTEKEMKFYVLKQFSAEAEESPFNTVPQPVEVIYDYDFSIHAIVRKSSGYLDLLNARKENQKMTPALYDVEAYTFRYYHQNPEIKGAYWKKGWDKACLPAAVKVSLKMKDFHGERITRLIDVPAGNCRP